MSIRALRLIMLFFIAAISAGDTLYFQLNPEIKVSDPIEFSYAISILILILFGLSYIDFFKKRLKWFSFFFNILISTWYIGTTIWNQFSPDYSLALVFSILMLGVFSYDIKTYFYYFSYSILLIMTGFFIVKKPEIDMYTFLWETISAGFIIYFILKSRNKTTDRLIDEQNKLKAIFDCTPEMFIFVDINYSILSFNKLCHRAMIKIYNREIKINDSIMDFIPEENKQNFKVNFDKCANGEKIKYEKEITFSNGYKIWTSVTYSPVYGNDNRIIGVAFTSMNINDRKKAEFGKNDLLLKTQILNNELKLKKEELEVLLEKAEDINKKYIESEQRYKELVESLPSMIYEVDHTGKFTYVNDFAYNSTGYDENDFNKGVYTLDMFPVEEQLRVKTNENKTVNGEKLGSVDYILKKKDGSLMPVRIYTIPIKRDDIIVGRRGVVIDITQEKKSEEKIKASLEEKEVLLKEIYHRVKNNLQVISALLNLQSSYLKDNLSKIAFNECRNRITSMSLVHEMLYRSDNLSKIDYKNYIKDLISNLIVTYSSESKNIEITMDIENIYLNLDTSIPLGLIITEIVSNTFKYAFPNSKKARLIITLKQIQYNNYELIIKDNGIGLPIGFNIDNSETLGLKLVTSLISQISGKLELFNENGTCYKINY
ncbi:MAG: PAS domain S-box protein [Bacteroidota bacterium]|nr:PAS domain S-box protein [Bacteroidota bacterium]